MNVRKFILLNFMILLCILLKANNISISTNQYKSFKNIDLPLNRSAVNTLFQDDKGMIWIGTRKGLYNYNGYQIHSFMNDKLSDGNSITSIQKIDKNHICIGTDYGIFWFNLDKEQYESLYPQVKRVKAVRSLALIKNKLWIGSRDQGLFCFDFKTKHLTKYPFGKTIIYSLQSTNDKLFIGAYNGLSYYDINKRKREIITFPNNKKIMVNSLLWDKERNSIWVGTEGQLYEYELATKQIKALTYAKGNSFKTLKKVQNNLLIGTDNGLYILNLQTSKLFHIMHNTRNVQSLCNNVIWNILIDKDHNVWLGTDRGISMKPASYLFDVVPLSEISESGDGNMFTSIFIDSAGRYWLGGENGLIMMQKNSGTTCKIRWFHSNGKNDGLAHNRIRSIYEDKEKCIWIATDGGISRYDEHMGKFVHYTITDRTGTRNANWAYSIYEDDNGRLWVGSYLGGLFVLNKKELIKNGPYKTFHTINNITNCISNWNIIGNVVYKIIPGVSGKLWLNTQNGLAWIDEKTFSTHLCNIFLDDMVCDKSNVVWYSSLGRIYKYANSHIQPIFSSSYIKEIYCLLIKDKYIWFSTNNGIYSINKITCKLKEMPQPPYICYSGFYNANEGCVLWGCNDCMVYMNSTESKEKKHYVYITSIKCDGEQQVINYKPLNSDNTIRINPSENVTLELSTFKYSLIGSQQFFYKFKNESSWHILDKNQNQITFFNLSSGEYTLYLCDANPEYGNGPVSIYKLEVPYPWYESVYAVILYIIILSSVIWLAIKRIQFMNKKKYKQKEREKSLELSNKKMEFFVNISHELKTPLSLVIAPLSKIISETKDEKQKLNLGKIYNNSLQLNMLIHKILDFKRIDYEDEEILVRSHVELNNLIQNSIHLFKGVSEERGIKISLQSYTGQIWLNLDVIKMESVFINVLSNSMKYVSDNYGKININLTKEENDVIIAITDNGTGIDEKEISLVFLRFFQGNNKMKKEGSGIGLYLVRKFVELHDGKVTIQNNKVGDGTRVEITLPLKGNNSIEEENKEPQHVIPNDNIISSSILIIDDNKEMVAFLVETLSKYYYCLKAYNGKEGIEIVHTHSIDLIIVDEMMPIMNGSDFCKEIKHQQITASIPIIMLTAKDDMETEINSIKIGIDAFISKPFDVRKLMLRIAQLIQNRAVIKKNVKIQNITETFENNIISVADEKSSDEILLEKIAKAIEDNIENEEFNVTALSNIIGIEQKQLYRKMKQLIGMTPVSYIRQIKIKKAAILLKQNKFTVSEVMFMVGYTNASYFTKQFIKEYGVTPKQYISDNK